MSLLKTDLPSIAREHLGWPEGALILRKKRVYLVLFRHDGGLILTRLLPHKERSKHYVADAHRGVPLTFYDPHQIPWTFAKRIA